MPHQASYFCPHCQQQRLFTAPTMNNTAHILASVFLCGLWLPVWIIMAISHKPRFHCSQCGFSDSIKYLSNPNLRKQEAQQKRVKQQQKAEYRLLHPSPLVFQWLSDLSDTGKILISTSSIIVGFAAIVIVSNLPESSRQSTAPQHDHSAFEREYAKIAHVTPAPAGPDSFSASPSGRRQVAKQLQSRFAAYDEVSIYTKGDNDEILYIGFKGFTARDKSKADNFVDQFRSKTKGYGFKRIEFGNGLQTFWTYSLNE